MENGDRQLGVGSRRWTLAPRPGFDREVQPRFASGGSNPNHEVISKSGSPASGIVGTSGSRLARLGTVTASALTFPPLICDPMSATLENIIDTSPPKRPAIPGPEPLYGICWISMPVMDL